jgi:hypothetical protein
VAVLFWGQFRDNLIQFPFDLGQFAGVLITVNPVGVIFEKHLQTVPKLPGHERWIGASHQSDRRVGMPAVEWSAVANTKAFKAGFQ